MLTTFSEQADEQVYLKHNRTHIVQALDASLKRLQTDWIDLYQLHWPERSWFC